VSARIRRATPDDIEAIVRIKQALAIDRETDAARGGFLLGCSAERYALFVEAAHVLVLEQDGEVAGFAITLPDPVLRASDLWARRERIRWHCGEGPPREEARIGYFEQLALTPGSARTQASALALAAVRNLSPDHDLLFATTLTEPVRNGAALPLLRGSGARPVAVVEEIYHGVGPVTSQLYRVPLGELEMRVAASPLGRRIAACADRLLA
jgi:hypothetical protein